MPDVTEPTRLSYPPRDPPIPDDSGLAFAKAEHEARARAAAEKREEAAWERENAERRRRLLEALPRLAVELGEVLASGGMKERPSPHIAGLGYASRPDKAAIVTTITVDPFGLLTVEDALRRELFGEDHRWREHVYLRHLSYWQTTGCLPAFESIQSLRHGGGQASVVRWLRRVYDEQQNGPEQWDDQ